VWLTPTDFSTADGRDEIADSERKITEEGLHSCSAVLVPHGSVIMASRATIGAVRIAAVELSTNQGFISFVCDERRLHNRFLYYIIEGFLGDYFAEIAPRTTFAEISRGRAKQTAIGFPTDVKEQRLIADYLDVSCAAIDAVAPRRATRQGVLSAGDTISQQINTLAAYRKSVIHECVTGRRRVNEADLRRAQAHG
jgi:type I restriction enzyme S subunit